MFNTLKLPQHSCKAQMLNLKTEHQMYKEQMYIYKIFAGIGCKNEINYKCVKMEMKQR